MCGWHKECRPGYAGVHLLTTIGTARMVRVTSSARTSPEGQRGAAGDGGAAAFLGSERWRRARGARGDDRATSGCLTGTRHLAAWRWAMSAVSGGALVADYATGGFYDEMFTPLADGGVEARPHYRAL